MHGSLNFRSPLLPLSLVSAIAAIIIGVAGCSGSGNADKSKPAAESKDVFIVEHEKSFNPSRYNPDVSFITDQENALYNSIKLANVSVTALPETIPGFRIQVILTQDIDQAMAVRDSLTTQFEDELVYVVYDAPYYKIRIGNYADRALANPLLRKLKHLGFDEAWVVPDNVLKNPPPKLPDENIEPKNPIENRR